MSSLPSRLFFVLKEGFRQTVRARGLSVAVIVVVAATLTQLSIFLGISRTLDYALASAQEKLEMAVFLAPSATVSDRKQIQDSLAADARVASVKAVPKEEALREFRKDPKIDKMIQALGENPLTDSLSVVLRKDALEDLEGLVSQLKKNPQVEEVSYGKTELRTVSSLTRTARWAGLVLGGMIFLAALFVVSNTLALALWARREDLTLFSRMGAPSWMRWGPYLFEGILQGLAGAVVTALFLEISRHGAGLALQKIQGLEALAGLPDSQWWNLYWNLAALGGGLGAAGAFLALRRKWVRDLL